MKITLTLILLEKKQLCFKYPIPRHKMLPLILIIICLLIPWPVLASPYGGQVTIGQAVIVQSGKATDINQDSHKATINWQGFSINSGETVNFNQPSASSMTLNRVVGSEKSLINGALNANGRVFLLNSNGVLIGKGASVNTGGLVASALDISEKDFENDNFVFQAAGPGGEVINRGKITVPDGGYAVLLGEKVINEGVILAQKGTISLNGAQRAVLNFNGDSLVSVSLDEGAVAALVENKGAVYADGGQIIMTSKAADYLADSQINTEGLLQAQTLGELSGRIVVYAYGGTANVRGTLDASAPKGGNGGFIETSGDKVKIADSARITTLAASGNHGKLLIDPSDYTVAASGGDITGSTLSLLLAGGPVEILSSNGKKKDGSGDINILDGITWSADTILTLTAERDINIKAPVTINGIGGGLVLDYGNGGSGNYYILTPASFSGAEFDSAGRPIAKTDTSGGLYGSINFGPAGGYLKIENAEYEIINNEAELEGIGDISRNYAVGRDLDFSGKTFTNSIIGVLHENYELLGLGHSIKNLNVEFTMPARATVWLGGLISSSEKNTLIRDLGIINLNLLFTPLRNLGDECYVGALIAVSNSNIEFVYISGGSIKGQITGNYWMPATGGLVGKAQSGSIVSSFSTINLLDLKAANIGGLVSTLNQLNSDDEFIIINSHYSGPISTTYYAGSGANGLGGLIALVIPGSQSSAGSLTIDKSYFIGSITGLYTSNNSSTKSVGGLIGNIGGSSYDNEKLSVKNSFAVVEISAGANIGGAIGVISNFSNVSIDNCYTAGSVENLSPRSLSTGIGGFIGYWQSNTANSLKNVSNSYSSVNVVSNNEGGYTGGFIGHTAQYTYFYNVYATGSVKQTNEWALDTGGFAGSLSEFTTFENCYASGLVESVNNLLTGGFAGGASLNANFINSYYNSDSSNQFSPIGPGYNYEDSSYINFIEGVGLTNDQFNDIQYYIDGSIDTVLTDRADARQTEIDRQTESLASALLETQAAAQAAAEAIALELSQIEAKESSLAEVMNIKEVNSGTFDSVKTQGLSPITPEAAAPSLEITGSNFATQSSLAAFSGSSDSAAASFAAGISALTSSGAELSAGSSAPSSDSAESREFGQENSPSQTNNPADNNADKEFL
jgi:filamentous hemagglutinin family protein